MGPIVVSPGVECRAHLGVPIRRELIAVLWLTARMQIRQSSVRGDRPRCPLDRTHKVHSHGDYERYLKADGEEMEKVPRWLCVVCGGTISVLPDTRLPYRPVGVGLVEAYLDAVFMARAPPKVTEKEKGCLERAHTRFRQRIPSLTVVLGQMIEVINPTATQLWIGLRKLGKLGKILRCLAEDFKTSLLGDYRCLHPWVVSC